MHTKGFSTMNLLPTTNFLGKTVTRMIVGDNPQTGHSYIVDRITGDEMKAFYTPEKILETLFVIQDAGYNTIMPLSTAAILLYTSVGHQGFVLVSEESGQYLVNDRFHFHSRSVKLYISTQSHSHERMALRMRC